MAVNESFIIEAKRLIYKINSYAEMIYSDAVLLDLTEFADYWRDVIAHASEVKRILVQAVPKQDETNGLEKVVKEEISRRCHIIRRLLTDLDTIIAIEKFPEIQSDIETISSIGASLHALFEKHLHITSDNLNDIPLDELQHASDYSLSRYLAGMSDRVKNAGAGTIVFAGANGTESKEIQQMLMNAAFHTVILSDTDSLQDVLLTYDVSLICYDCGTNTKLGFDTLQLLIDNPSSADIPVLVCGSEFSDLLAMQFIESGAVDYYSSSKSKRVLFARIQAAIIRAKNNYHRQLYIRALEMNSFSTSKEFREAAEYVADLLPKPFTSPFLSVDWAFLPSLKLGGDVFGYKWVNEHQFVLYLLDVSGHGLEASLYSVTVMNLLKKELLGSTDFLNPSSVLQSLNKIFDIESQNNMFFTIWYGVYNTQNRELSYASAGSQPAVLVKNETTQNLSSGGLIIGIDDDAEYNNNSVTIEPETDLYIFSDGIYELQKEDGSMMSLDDFTSLLKHRAKEPGEKCVRFARRVEQLSKSGQFEDDVSLIHLHFS